MYILYLNNIIFKEHTYSYYANYIGNLTSNPIQTVRVIYKIILQYINKILHLITNITLFPKLADSGKTCNLDEFACFNGACIDKEKRCDRVNDCDDLSDEFNCGG